MNTVEIAAQRYREVAFEAIAPMQIMKGVSRPKFEMLHDAAASLATALKDKEEISKSLLNELYSTIQVLRNEAPHQKADREYLESLANRLEYCFGLILLGEDHSDRIPGKPRII
jgi:hypothetical protein